MAQHDYDIANAAGAPFRADLNLALGAAVTNNSGSTAPATAFAYMWWVDTTAGLLKQRNAANSAWVNVLNLATGLPSASGPVATTPEMQAGSQIALRSMSPALIKDAIAANSGGAGLFFKADASSVAFTKTGAGTVSIKAGTRVDVLGTQITFATATAVVMPTLSTGTDYAIYAATDGTVRADANFSAPTGYTTANTRKIGGFHYAPGGNAAAQSGGDTTPAINEYSIWDLKFKPAASDPRGMTLVSGGFWADIYFCGTDHYTNGTSKYNVLIADGSSAPKIPAAFGGNGTTNYGSFTWWEANETLAAYGKRSPRYAEFAALAYGTTEASSVGSDQLNTVLNAAYTSKWGVMQAAGVMWSWGNEFGGGSAGAAWSANTEGRGSTYQLENAVLFGGAWGDGADSGSRCSFWNFSPTISSSSISARGVCDHLILE